MNNTTTVILGILVAFTICFCWYFMMNNVNDTNALGELRAEKTKAYMESHGYFLKQGFWASTWTKIDPNDDKNMEALK